VAFWLGRGRVVSRGAATLVAHREFQLSHYQVIR
jgi:hypothetical protein